MRGGGFRLIAAGDFSEGLLLVPLPLGKMVVLGGAAEEGVS